MQPHWVIVAQLVMLPGVIIAGSLLYSVLYCRPRIDDSVPADLVILAAHPDDCVIVAGEYAQVTIQGRRSVRVVYLTCGSSDSRDARAQQRRRESIDAWSLLGVPESCLTFLDYPHTDPNTGSTLTDTMRAEAEQRLIPIFQDLPPNTRMFLPAQGETHVDHRALRSIALRALQASRRPDVQTIESPEYNPYLSLARAPGRSIMYLLASMPLLARLLDRRRFVPPPTFFEGPPGLILPPSHERIEMKIRMLRCFTSENENDLLVRTFGFPDHYRVFNPVKALAESHGKFFFRIGERFLSPGLMACWLTLWASILMLLYLTGRQKVKLLGETGLTGSTGIAIGVTAAVGIALLAFALVKRHSLERRVTIFVGGMGLIAGGLAAEEALLGAMGE